jgi:tetratricopeptide (TPR) repeat protein
MSFASAFTGPQTPPNPEELRQMFAQLAPDTQASEGSGASAFAARDFPLGPATPVMPDSTQLAAEQQWPEALADAFEWPSQPGAASSPSQPTTANYGLSGSQAAPDVTLEALENAHSAHGYQPFTLEPGALAAFTGAGQSEPAYEAASALDNFFQGPEEPPLPPIAEEPPAPLPELEPEPLPEPLPEPEPAIDPADYPARLAAARSLHEAGDLDEALLEYRAILKNSPDLLPDALSDLETALEEHPEHPELHRLLGDARIRQGDYMAALESLNRSVALDQTDED